MTARGVWEVVSTAIVTGAALSMLGFYLYDRARPSEARETYMPGWEEWDESAIRIGPEDATMVVAAFMDFTCPYCKDLVPVLDSVLTEFEGDVALQFHHFPLDNHEFALPTAVAAECANRQGNFTEMYRTLYALMDSVSVRPWGAFAVDAGILDIPAFETCVQLPPEAFERIAAGRALGERIGVIGTPTVWVNGTLFNGRSVAVFRDKAEQLAVSARNRNAQPHAAVD